MKNIISSGFMLALLFFSAAASPQVTRIEPDHYQENQSLTNVVNGVTLTVANGDGVPQPTSQVVAFEGDLSSTGSLVFGRQVQAFTPDDHWCLTSIFVHSIFRADFDTPVAGVSVDVIRSRPNIGALLAYDSSGTLLDTALAGHGDVGTFAAARIRRPSADIAYILAGGYPRVSSPPCNVVALDNLRIRPDPITGRTFSTKEYFPLQSGDQWTYQVDGDPNDIASGIVLAGTLMVNEVPTKGLQTNGPLGISTDYFTNDNNGIRLHRQVNEESTVTFEPPIQLAESTTSLGQEISTNGTVTMDIPELGTFELDYTSISRVPSFVTSAVPAGHFDSVRFELTFTITGSVLGTPIESSETDTYWLAEHIGALRSSYLFEEQTTEFELLSAFVDHDSDGISATVDNCPVVNNPGQENTDGDSRGNACDSDDDNDGIDDEADAFPLDPNEWLDTDADGTGNNADLDDDNDLMPDDFEIDNDLDPLDPSDATEDRDGDGFSNGAEFQAGTDIDDPNSNPAANYAAVTMLLKLILDN